MGNEKDYVDYFYEKYPGRVAIGVGYGQDLTEIYPLVFINIGGDAIGIVAMGVLPDEKKAVYIYHIGAFNPGRGNGSTILKELCRQADKFNICLRASAIILLNGQHPEMNTKRLSGWYKSFGFEDDAGLLRNPQQGISLTVVDPPRNG